MEQYHLYAYEALGLWHISLTVRTFSDELESTDITLYRGTHVAIDEEDPEVRAVLILSQVGYDLNQAIRGNMDILADRPPHH